MNLTTMYFTSTSNFKEIVETIRTADEIPEQIDGNFLEDLGYTEPADLLILRFLKIIDFINDDDTPSPLLEKFRESGSSKEVFARGVLKAYGELFDKDPTIHKKSKEDIIQLLQASLDEKKSNIIIGYMANTFQILVEYVGEDTISEILQNDDIDDDDIFDLPELDDVNHDQYKPNGEQKDASDEKTESKMEVEASNSNESEQESNTKEPDLEVSSMSSLTTKELETSTKKEVSESVSTNISLTLPPTPEMETSKEKTKSDYINKAYIRRADLLYRLDRLEEALPALDKVYEKFADSDEDQLSKVASVALVKKMDTAERLDLNDSLISIYSEVITRLEDVENSKFVPFVDHAYINITETLFENDQHNKALELILKAIDRFKKTENNSDFLAKAMYLKADLLEKTGSDEEALTAFDDFLNTYGDHTDN